MSEDLPDVAAEVPRTPYAGQIITHLNQDHLDRLTGVFEEIGVSDWLEQNPLAQIELAETVLNPFGVAVNGMYSYKSNTLQVSTKRSKQTYGQPFEWERVYSVSSTAQTQADAIRMTLVHELGHHIHSTLGKLDPTRFSETMRLVRFRGGTTYSKNDNLEYFAESFALYTFYSSELLVRDPQGYDMIEKALRRIGLEVTQQ